MATQEQKDRWKREAEAKIAEEDRAQAALDAMMEQFRADCEKRAKAAHQAKELTPQERYRAEQQAEADRKEAHAKAVARAVYLDEGGAEEGFEKVWEKMYADMLYQQTLRKMKAGVAGIVSAPGRIRL